MNAYFYDIESLDNVFTLANYRDKDNVIEIYYLIDDKSLIPDDFLNAATQAIHDANRNFHEETKYFKGSVELYDLSLPESNIRLAKTFGLSDAYYINNPNARSSYAPEYRIVCDTDPDYDEETSPYLLGYNSFHYDLTMLTYYLYNVFDDRNGSFHCQTAKSMRQFNDELFSDMFDGPCRNMEDRLRYTYKDPYMPSKGYDGPDFKLPTVLIRKNMLMSGRHLDAARLNEKQSKVGLKRLLGMQGYQILESDKLRPGQNHIESADQLLDLFAYNVSDVVNLKKLCLHKTYKSSFTLKRQLLKTYPELVYSKKKDAYAPDISQTTVRGDRLIIDSSSAQFSTKSLCPYDHLQDYDTVSFMYPSEAKAKALGIPRVNVLEEARAFFYRNFPQSELRARFDEIYKYYKSIEGKNFNSSANYLVDHGLDSSCEPDTDLPIELRPYKLSDIPAPNTCMFYYKKDGTPSTCFVNFSTGGIHGAEYNKKLYDYDMKEYEAALVEWQKKVDLFDKAKAIYPNPCDLKAAKNITIEGIRYTPSTFLKPRATTTEAYYKDPPKPPKMPTLFVKSESQSGSITYNLAKRYAYTSAAMTNHEDFTSYYPNMLRMMDAFYNPGLGYDRYGEIFNDKTRYGKLMKDESLSQEERDLYAVMREGTKLILNSASGAGDANFESNIRMNNKIISMRIIGQLFTWRIGQAQTIEGASIISTNTDGLYSVLDAEENNKILAREAESIHVDIEPEPIFLISKDSNNRVEVEVENGQLTEVTSASGGTLSCRKGPTPTKSLAHPAIIDWALTEYLILASINYKGLSLTAPFDNTIGQSIIASARKIFNDDIKTLLMFQNVIASSPGSQRFVFATTDDANGEMTVIPLQHYNRCFIAKDRTPNTYHLKAAVAKVITEATRKKRAKTNERAQQHDKIASEILAINGVKSSELSMNKEATVVKITGVEDSWYIRVDNRDLHFLTQEEIDDILDNLDYDKYLSMLRDTFENNWRNATPEQIIADKEKALQAKEEEKMPHSLFDDEPLSSSSATDDTVNVASAVNDNSHDDTVQITSPAHAVSNEPDNTKTVETEHVVNNTSPNGDFMSDIELPKMISLDKTLLSPVDIKNGEHVLCMNGIREISAHGVLAQLLKTMTNTNIDS